MAEADAVSTTSSTDNTPGLQGLADIPVTSDKELTGAEADDKELVEAAGRLNLDLTLEPDADIQTHDSDSVGAASTSSSSIRDSQDQPGDSDSGDSDDEYSGSKTNENNNAEKRKEGEGKKTGDGGGKDSKTAKPDKNGTSHLENDIHRKASLTSKDSGKSKKRKNPFSVLKKLTKFDKSKQKQKEGSFSEFEMVRIDKLPQVFVAKYLGVREVKGFCGLHHVRKPVDEMVTKVQKSLEKQEPVELPLVYIVVSPRGLDVREHKLNKQKEGVPVGVVPIDFISYGVQDIKYWRVFTFIVVKELSSRSKVTECHAYLCDSSLNARKMALSLGASFKVYSRSLKKEGKPHNFQVELRPPDELAEALTEADCDA